MRRILVPLDGTDLADSILPDAVRVAGLQGEIILVLVRDLTLPTYDLRPEQTEDAEENIFTATVKHVETQAAALRQQGYSVDVHVLGSSDSAQAIDQAADYYGADMIACATHGRSGWQRLVRGSVAWKAVAHSGVPVLIRHAEAGTTGGTEEPATRRILVPLDGSALAETAVPLAEQLAQEWEASVWLTQVVLTLSEKDLPARAMHVPPAAYTDEISRTHAYLERIAGGLSGDVHTVVLTGKVVDSLTEAVAGWNITDIVMASHGRTGLARVIVGSVADDLIQHLTCPIFVVPAHAVHHKKAEATALAGDAAAAAKV